MRAWVFPSLLPLSHNLLRSQLWRAVVVQEFNNLFRDLYMFSEKNLKGEV